MDNSRRDGTSTDVAISWEHHLVHESRFFSISDFDPNVLIATPKYWHLKVKANASFHMTFEIACDTGMTFELFEAPTLTADGSAVPVRRFNRVIPRVAPVEAFSDPTVSADGLNLQKSKTGTVQFDKFPGVHRQGVEWVLLPDTSYLFKVTVDQDNATVNLDIEGYGFGG